MALGGLAPILVFNFPLNVEASSPIFNAISGIPVVGEFATLATGIPIPLYLDERITGIYVDTQEKHLDIDTSIESRYDNKKPLIYQKGLNSSITVNLLANKDSIILPALFALIDLIVPRLVSSNYRVSYFNGSILVLNGLLQGLNTNEGSNDDLIRISLQIQKTDQTPEQATGGVLTATTGVTPL